MNLARKLLVWESGSEYIDENQKKLIRATVLNMSDEEIIISILLRLIISILLCLGLPGRSILAVLVNIRCNRTCRGFVTILWNRQENM